MLIPIPCVNLIPMYLEECFHIGGKQFCKMESYSQLSFLLAQYLIATSEFKLENLL